VAFSKGITTKSTSAAATSPTIAFPSTGRTVSFLTAIIPTSDGSASAGRATRDGSGHLVVTLQGQGGTVVATLGRDGLFHVA
jgi:hypothetical protein